jgi:hypothetical protein
VSRLSCLLCAGYISFNLTREFAGVFAGVWGRNLHFAGGEDSRNGNGKASIFSFFGIPSTAESMKDYYPFDTETGF